MNRNSLTETTFRQSLLPSYSGNYHILRDIYLCLVLWRMVRIWTEVFEHHFYTPTTKPTYTVYWYCQYHK